MTAPPQDQYVTRDELAARLAEFELRIITRMDDHFRTQTRWLVGLYAAVALAALVFAVK